MEIFDKAKDLVEEHDEQVEDAIEKVADFVDDKVGADHADDVHKAADAAKGLVEKLDDDK